MTESSAVFPRRLLAGFLALCLSLATAVSAADEKLNFLFILADDLGYMDVGFNNANTFYETPNLDLLAASGMVFTDFYAACQVCSPTRASILTGKYPARSNTTNFFSGRRAGTFLPADFETHMALEEVTLAEALKEHNYRTFFAGKWHLGPKGYWPTDQGFDINMGGGVNGLPRSYFSPYRNVENLPAGPEGEFLTNRLATESVKFLDGVKQIPFLLYLSFHSVHTPLQAPKDLIAKYEAKAKKLGRTNDKGRWGTIREVDPKLKLKGPRKLRIRQDHATYAAMVESLDTAVGRVLDRLNELGLKDNTAVIFMSDNGGVSTSEGWPTSNLPYKGAKGWMYEGGIREPVVIRWPGVTPPGTRCNVPAISTDFYPTMLDMAGFTQKGEQHVDGKSLVPLLRNPFAKFRRGPIFWHYPHYANQGGFPASAIRDGDYKLIQDLEDGAVELYNLIDDPEEHNNLEQLESDRAEEMLASLKAWRKEVAAMPLRKNPKTGATPPIVD